MHNLNFCLKCDFTEIKKTIIKSWVLSLEIIAKSIPDFDIFKLLSRVEIVGPWVLVQVCFC